MVEDAQTPAPQSRALGPAPLDVFRLNLSWDA